MTGIAVVSARRRRLLAHFLGFAAALAPGTARALDAEVTSDSAAQFYDVRSPAPTAFGNITVLNRRRLTTTLGLGVYNLLDAPQGDPKAPDPLVSRAPPVRRRLRHPGRPDGRARTRRTTRSWCLA